MVWRLDPDGFPQRVPVSTGLSDEQLTENRHPLREGDYV